MKTQTITTQITAKAFELLENNPEGLRWVDLSREIKASGSFHPKTVNGIIWQLPAKYPDEVYKPKKGLFRLTKYKKADEKNGGVHVIYS